MTSAPACRFPRRRLALAGLLTSAAVLAGSAVSAPAFADTRTVTTKADLDEQLSQGTSATVVLGASLTDADAQHDSITVPAGSVVTLDLNGHKLTLRQLAIGAAGTLVIVDAGGSSLNGSYNGSVRGLWVGTQTPPYSSGSTGSTGSSTVPSGIEVDSRATLRVDGAQLSAFGSAHAPGIGSPAGLTADPGHVVAQHSANVYGQGGDGGAGIGGGEGAAAVSIDLTDSVVGGGGGEGGAGLGGGADGVSAGRITAMTSPYDRAANVYPWALLSGHGGAGGAGIGGGLHGSGAQVQLDGVASATASLSSTTSGTGAPSAVGAGQAPTAASGTGGSLTIGRDSRLTVPEGSVLSVPEDETVLNGGHIYLGGRITGAGTVANTGTIDFAPSFASGATGPVPHAQMQMDPGDRVSVARVTGYNYAIDLDTNGSSTPSSTAHVYQSSFETDSLPDPQAPISGQSVLGWNTRRDGSGGDPGIGGPLQTLFGGPSTDGAPVIGRVYAQYGEAAHLTGTTMPNASAGNAYDQALPIAGGGYRVIWVPTVDERGNSLPGLPAGLYLDPTGRVRGTPTESGSFTFGVRTYGKQAVSGQVTMVVLGTPVVATRYLPGAQQDQAFSVQLAATGNGPITWSAGDGGLPAGLALSSDGLLTGRPTRAGIYDVEFVAANSAGATRKHLSLYVESPETTDPGDDDPGDSTDDPQDDPTPVTQPTTELPVAAPAAPAAHTPTAPLAAAPPATAPLSPPAPAASTEVPTTAPAATAPTSVAPAVTAPAAAPVSAPVAAPVLAALPRTTAKFGHRLDLAVAASSSAPITWSISGHLPKGVAFTQAGGAISGVPAEEGVFTAVVTATNTGGSTSREVVIAVPAVQELIDTKPVPAVKVGAQTVPIQVTGVKKGEHWRVVVDGKTVATGTAKTSGTVKTTISLGKAKRDTEHSVVVTTSRKVTDPAQRAATSFTITSVAAKKRLTMAAALRDGRSRVTVTDLADGERVEITERGELLAKGTADDDGRFTFTSKKLARGTHALVVHGATDTRVDTLTIRGGKG